LVDRLPQWKSRNTEVNLVKSHCYHCYHSIAVITHTNTTTVITDTMDYYQMCSGTSTHPTVFWQFILYDISTHQFSYKILRKH